MDGGLSRGNKAAFSNSPPQRGRAPSLETHMLDFTRAHQVTFIEMRLDSDSQANTLFSVIFGQVVVLYNRKLIINSKKIISVPTHRDS